MGRRSGYASSTTVSADRTIAQIRALVVKFGAEQFLLAHDAKHATVGFSYRGVPVRFDLPLPSVSDPEFQTSATGRSRTDAQIASAHEAAVRSQWRSLFALLKALLVAVEDGLIPFERAFFYDTVTPDGRTVGQHMLPSVSNMLSSGRPIPLALPFTDD